MRESHKCAVGVVLWLNLGGCSVRPEEITLTPLAPREFDNPFSSGDAASSVEPDASATSEDKCPNGRVDVTRVAPKVVLVLDGSCSMSTDYPAMGAPSASFCARNARGRWAALRNALIGAQGIVPKLEKSVAFGLVVYGTTPSCPIPGRSVSAELNNVARVRAALPEIQPGMYTPTGPALEWVYDNMITARDPDDRGASQIVILATDGEPNSCGAALFDFFGVSEGTNYQPSLDAVKKGSKKGATTYVISLADATGPFHDHLQELANLGDPAASGGAKLYEPASPDQLAQTLEALAGAAVSCEIELSGSIVLEQACWGAVTLDGSELGCDDPNGWAAIDERRIRLQGSACDQVRERGETVVEAKFSCAGFQPD